VYKCVKFKLIDVMYVVVSTATETLAFLCEKLKSHDLGPGRRHVIKTSKLPKIAKINCVRPAVPYWAVVRSNTVFSSGGILSDFAANYEYSARRGDLKK
jgi:hypothetical protein